LVNRKGFIVIHEEDDLIRELLERWLGEAGYSFALAEQRIRRAKPRGEAPRLVIANVASPRGAQPLIDSLRAVYAAPILILSARFRRGLEGSAEAAQRLGVRRVLPKPFTREEFLSAVRESIQHDG
jgi:DNA-binding response OmpR family regulator